MNHSGMETNKDIDQVFAQIGCVRTIVVWKLGRPDDNVNRVLVLRKNHSGMLRAVVGGSWLVVGQEQRTRTRSS